MKIRIVSLASLVLLVSVESIGRVPTAPIPKAPGGSHEQSCREDPNQVETHRDTNARECLGSTRPGDLLSPKAFRTQNLPPPPPGSGPRPLGPALPDLVVSDIMLTRNPGYEAGRLLIIFRDALGRAHHRAYHDAVRESRRRAGRSTNDESVYPFDYRVYVDGLRIRTASVRTSLPRSGSREVVTEGYWLPGDGRPHQVRVEARPVVGDLNPGNNELTRELRAEPFTGPRVALLVWSPGVGLRAPLPSPLDTWIPYPPIDRGILVAPPGYGYPGYYYTVPATSGWVSPGQCVNSGSLDVRVRGTVGNTRLRRVTFEFITGDRVVRHEDEIRGRTLVDGVWREAGAPYGEFESFFRVDVQSLASQYSNSATIRVMVTEEGGGGGRLPDFQFELAGYEYLAAVGGVTLSVDRVGNRRTHLWSSASRGATNITIRREEHLLLHGSITLAYNCILRNTQIGDIDLILWSVGSADRLRHFSGVGNVYSHTINRVGPTTTFEADFNIRNGEPGEEPGTYELRLYFPFSDLTGAHPNMGGILSAVPPLIVTVTE